MHKHLLAAVLSLAVAMTGASALEAHAKTTFVTIGTGGITGVYYPTGGAIAKIVNAKKDKYDIRRIHRRVRIQHQRHHGGRS